LCFRYLLVRAVKCNNRALAKKGFEINIFQTEIIRLQLKVSKRERELYFSREVIV
jgi:hypothetical protein